MCKFSSLYLTCSMERLLENRDPFGTRGCTSLPESSARPRSRIFKCVLKAPRSHDEDIIRTLSVICRLHKVRDFRSSVLTRRLLLRHGLWWATFVYQAFCPVSYTHLTLPTTRIV
eukprot:TRINITY_DN53615_c0_g1_i1.p1 TRINITY_DN53615_c0_g1~~TRINITY_DN53615_c0_g1_i1.p1  ORF type:complete len:115 (-),score=0.97 TRINITY_DN53615_c0_g1_i1:54-398(-)